MLTAIHLLQAARSEGVHCLHFPAAISSARPLLLRVIAGLLLLACLPASAFAVACKVAEAAPVTDAEQAYLHGDYDRAAALYQQQLQQKANDPALIADLSQVLLKQQKVKAAEDLVQTSLVAHPQSVALLTALANIQYREGAPWLAATTAGKALQTDPCYPKLHLFNARLLRLNSYYGSAAQQLGVAHALDPHDPATRLLWLNSLPRTERIAELESYLAAPSGDDPQELAHLHSYLDYLQKEVKEPRKACRLVSPVNSTSVDFIKLMRDATHMEAFGLPVRFNDHAARLELDTGASGLVITRAVADRAGLKPFARGTVSGIGSEGERAAYAAFADDIKIGALEFRDCEVDVIDKRNALDIDGLIGADVFAHFLVTLDYPMRKLDLAPLPERPGDTAPRTPTLETANAPSEGPSSTASDSSASASPAKPAPRGPQDRYIAPEMKDWTHIYRVGHNLIVPAALNNSRQKLFILDTGAFTTSISPSAAAEVTKVHSDEENHIKGISGKVDKVYYADKINFKFAGLSQDIQDVVSFDTARLSKDNGMEVSGFIGITALGMTKMSIDYRDGLIKLSYDAGRGYSSAPFR